MPRHKAQEDDRANEGGSERHEDYERSIHADRLSAHSALGKAHWRSALPAVPTVGQIVSGSGKSLRRAVMNEVRC